PCPGAAAATVTPDLPDGLHTLTAVATDAAGQTQTSSTTTLKLDRVAPAAPLALTVERQPDDSFLYSWHNPDQAGAAPIAAVHLSDGTVIRGTNLQQAQASSGNLSVWLEDEAGNADAASAASATPTQPGVFSSAG